VNYRQVERDDEAHSASLALHEQRNVRVAIIGRAFARSSGYCTVLAGEAGNRGANQAEPLLLYRRLHEPRGVVTEFAHDFIVIRLFDAHGLQAILR
jgi:hypothetical protein